MSKSITKILIKNFRQYKKVEVNLKKSSKKNLNIIIGNNRFGKTNFLNAILWCLYGNDGISSEGSDSSMHYIKNERYSSENTEIVITLEDSEKGNVITIKRTEEGLKVLKGLSNSRPLSDLQAKKEIRSLLPQNVKNFFLFKGEFLDTFFEIGGTNRLRETIKEVSKINFLDKINSSLKNLENQYMKTIEKDNKNDKNIEEKRKKIENLDIAINKAMEESKEISEKIDGTESSIKEIDVHLRSINKEKIDQLIQREEELNEDKDRSIEKINKIKSKIMESFLRDSSKWMIYLAVHDFKKYMEKLRKNGLVPQPIKSETIKEIIKEKSCICGEKITLKMKENLKKLLSKFPKDDRLESLHEVNLALNFNDDKFDREYSQIKELFKDYSEEEEHHKNINQKILDINSELLGMDKEAIHKHAVKRELLQKELSSLKDQYQDKQVDLKDHEGYRKEIFSELQLYLSRKKGGENISKKLAICSQIKNKLDKLSEECLKDISQELNKKVVANFKNIFWENYQNINYKIKINENFDISVMSPEGNNLTKQLSTGEIKVLALSFIISLSEFYGFDFPIIIDAPFTALQKEVTEKMLKTLLKLSYQKQLIILTIPHEEKIMKELKDSSNFIYKMNKDNKDNTVLEEIKNV